MRAQKRLREAFAIAPASIGNFFVGFDVLGAALEALDGTLTGDQVTIRECLTRASGARLQCLGPYASRLPSNPRLNLVWHCHGSFHRVLRTRGVSAKPVDMILQKNLPLASGLGSSASSIVAALAALNVFYGNPLNSADLLDLAGQAEGSVSGSPHLDNVAPALLGGLQFIAPDPQRPLGKALSLPLFEEWKLVVVHPDLAVPTRKSRAVLPKALPLPGAVDYWQNLGAFLHALFTGNRSLACFTLRDLFMEEHRKKLVKGFAKVQAAALASGGVGCTLSGSGPSMVAVTETMTGARKVKTAMIEVFARQQVHAEGWICRLDQHGARYGAGFAAEVQS